MARGGRAEEKGLGGAAEKGVGWVEVHALPAQRSMMPCTTPRPCPQTYLPVFFGDASSPAVLHLLGPDPCSPCPSPQTQDLPVFFGDAGSPAVLHLLGAERAACAIIAMDTPGANYRAVYAMTKHFPKVKTFVRAHDISHGLNLEKAGATAVVPETLEPSLQLAAAVFYNMDYAEDEVGREGVFGA